MRGDILILKEEHYRAAGQIASLMAGQIKQCSGTFFISVAGESGAGKSETASALAETFKREGVPVMIVQQDDFFVYPPKTNASVRLHNGGKVGIHEVRLGLLSEIIRTVKGGRKVITKPLVIFAEDRITSETIDTSPFKIIIIEGTYTTLLEHIDCRIFIERDLHDTRADRLMRNREAQDGFLEKILETEHEIISGHKEKADLIISRDYNVRRISNAHDD
jgi:uridine kinase